MTVQVDLLRPVTDEDLLRLSERNPGYQFERTADGRLIVAPTGSQGGRRSGEVFRQLSAWNHDQRPGVVFDSSTGFRLPDGALFSPDASWVQRERWEALPREEREGFAPLCPDAVFEVLSATQDAWDLREKIRAYLRNGARIAILIDPYGQVVELWRPAAETEVHRDQKQVALDPELSGFVLDPRPVFEE